MYIEINPVEIERKSMEMIDETLKELDYDKRYESVIKRVIHTTADFDYARNLYFTENVVEIMKDAIKKGAHIVTDTNMCKSGINKRKLSEFGGEVHCFIADEDVFRQAKEKNTTRAIVSMEKSLSLNGPVIYALGNAPTALIRLCELIEENKTTPAAIIGAPVGFVNILESKEILENTSVPSIICKGRKGGSNVAAAIINAVLYSI